MKAILPFLLLLPACTVRPTIRDASGNMATLGGSIFSKSSSETASYSGPLGTMSYTDFGKDETVIPGKVVNYWGIKATIDGLTATTRAKESTTRILSKEDTKRQAIQSTERVDSLKVLNPVEEAAPSVFNPATGLNSTPP